MTIVNIQKERPPAGAYVSQGEVPSQFQYRSQQMGKMRQGTVRRVNSDTGQMDVELTVGNKAEPDITITFPYVGPAGMLGVCPEIGSLVLLMDTLWGLVPVAYKIPSPQFCNEYAMLSTLPPELSDPVMDMTRQMPAAFRAMRPGEARMASGMGADVFLHEDVELRDQTGNSFILRAGDNSAITTSQQNFMFTSGVARAAGPIMRNSLILQQDGDPIPGYSATEVFVADGKRVVYVGGDPSYGGRLYNEYRIDVEDSGPKVHPLNDVNSTHNVTNRRPTVVHMMGNYVGNDQSVESADLYGKFLAPSFVTGKRGEGNLGFKALLPNGASDDIGRLGVAWGYHVLDRGFFGVDKMGAQHTYLGAMGGITPGVSQIMVAQGGRREEWGTIRDGNLSWDMYCKGGIKWSVGKASEDINNDILPRSLEAVYHGGTYTEHGHTSTYDPRVLKDLDDNDIVYANKLKYRRVERVFGSSRDEVSASSEELVGVNKTLSVGSQYDIEVQGASSESIMGDKAISTQSGLSLNAKEIKVVTNKRSEKIALGSDEKVIVLGNEITAIAAGNQILSIVAGNSSTLIGTGNIARTVTAGNIADTIATGNYSLGVGAGNVSMQAGGAFVIGGTSINMTGKTSVSIVAPKVSVGLFPSLSGAITVFSHLDYVTGAPLRGSRTVSLSA